MALDVTCEVLSQVEVCVTWFFIEKAQLSRRSTQGLNVTLASKTSVFKSSFLLLTSSLCLSHFLKQDSIFWLRFKHCLRIWTDGKSKTPQPKSAGRTILSHSHVLIRSKNKPGPKDSQQQQRLDQTAAPIGFFKGQDANCSLGFGPVISQTAASNQQHNRVSLRFLWWSPHAFLLSLNLHQLMCVTVH